MLPSLMVGGAAGSLIALIFDTDVGGIPESLDWLFLWVQGFVVMGFSFALLSVGPRQVWRRRAANLEYCIAVASFSVKVFFRQLCALCLHIIQSRYFPATLWLLRLRVIAAVAAVALNRRSNDY